MMPTDAQKALLKLFLGSGAAGANRRMAEFRIPAGLTATTLRWYAGMARRAMADPGKATPVAVVVQRLRLRLVARALAADPPPDPEVGSGPSDAVRALQRTLDNVLERRLDVDGRLGQLTVGAVRAFQGLAGLGVDGIPGPDTRAALRIAAATPCTNHRQPTVILDGFEVDGSTVPAAQRPKVLHVARCVLAGLTGPWPMQTLRVVGHTDSEGSDAYNLALGRRRADEVARLLGVTLEAIRSGSSAAVNVVPGSRGENDAVSPDRARNRRVVIVLPHCTCAGFFREYDLLSSPSRRFGPAANERMTQTQRDERQAQVGALIPDLLRRRDRRATQALAGAVPAPEPVAAALVPAADALSDHQLALFRECFPGGSAVIDVTHLGECFERFANGELRDPVTGAATSTDPVEGFGEPEGGFFFLFAEFGFLCVDSGLNAALWLAVLPALVRTQEIFMHVYRVAKRDPAPPVGAPLPALGAAKRDLDVDFGFQSFNAAAQSDDARKAALRSKYAPMTPSALLGAARDNMLRAQRMP